MTELTNPEPSPSLKQFMLLPPKPGQVGLGADFRFRKVRDVHNAHDGNDLAPFVSMSDQSEDIAGSHPTLHGETRHELYKKWHAWNPDSFMILDHKDVSGNWNPVAVSIILPLSQEGFAALKHGENGKDAVTLEESEVVKKSADGFTASPYLLFDTWIIDPDFRQGKTHGYGQALLTKHLSTFWDPKKQSEVHLSVEPDAESVRHLAKEAGFHDPEPGSNFYDRPINTRELTTQPLLQKFVSNIVACQQWPVVGEPLPPSRRTV